MPYTITSNCISCDRCLSQCPTDAIRNEGLHYWIESDACNNCTGVYSVPQCAAVCPTNDGIATVESSTTLTAKGISIFDLQLSGPKQELRTRLKVSGVSKDEGSFSSSGQGQIVGIGMKVVAASGMSSLSGNYWESWFNTYHHLLTQMNQAKQARYWQQWFNTYSQVLSKQILSRKHQAVGREAYSHSLES
ncbi:MAG: 4Fe-4S dicluster domain-containing protein [Actinomycetota bacterium]